MDIVAAIDSIIDQMGKSANLEILGADNLREIRSAIVDARRYRWMRECAMRADCGLEAFVAMNQLDFVASEERFDAEIDRGMAESCPPSDPRAPDVTQ